MKNSSSVFLSSALVEGHVWEYFLFIAYSPELFGIKACICVEKESWHRQGCVLQEFRRRTYMKPSHCPTSDGYKRLKYCKGRVSKSEIMTILLYYHFGFPQFQAPLPVLHQGPLGELFSQCSVLHEYCGTHAPRVL